MSKSWGFLQRAAHWQCPILRLKNYHCARTAKSLAAGCATFRKALITCKKQDTSGRHGSNLNLNLHSVLHIATHRNKRKGYPRKERARRGLCQFFQYFCCPQRYCQHLYESNTDWDYCWCWSRILHSQTGPGKLPCTHQQYQRLYLWLLHWRLYLQTLRMCPHRIPQLQQIICHQIRYYYFRCVNDIVWELKSVHNDADCFSWHTGDFCVQSSTYLMRNLTN